MGKLDGGDRNYEVPMSIAIMMLRLMAVSGRGPDSVRVRVGVLMVGIMASQSTEVSLAVFQMSMRTVTHRMSVPNQATSSETGTRIQQQ